jgi:hypothetical protein
MLAIFAVLASCSAPKWQSWLTSSMWISSLIGSDSGRTLDPRCDIVISHRGVRVNMRFSCLIHERYLSLCQSRATFGPYKNGHILSSPTLSTSIFASINMISKISSFFLFLLWIQTAVAAIGGKCHNAKLNKDGKCQKSSSCSKGTANDRLPGIVPQTNIS